MARGRCTECSRKLNSTKTKLTIFLTIYLLLIHRGHQNGSFGQTIQNFKKIITKQWDSMGAADTDVVLRTIKVPDSLISTGNT